jgi:hypothetical protein
MTKFFLSFVMMFASVSAFARPMTQAEINQTRLEIYNFLKGEFKGQDSYSDETRACSLSSYQIESLLLNATVGVSFDDVDNFKYIATTPEGDNKQSTRVRLSHYQGKSIVVEQMVPIKYIDDTGAVADGHNVANLATCK